MAPHSAGILLYRFEDAELQVLLVHLGGPYWQRKDKGAWQIPKGLLEAGEDALEAAYRETSEELGIDLASPAWPLATIRQAGGKIVEAFALAQDVDIDLIHSNSFDMEWPPRSGRRQSFPEVDRALWFGLDRARVMILPSQLPLLDKLCERLEA